VDKESCRVTIDRERGASAIAFAPSVAAIVIRRSREDNETKAPADGWGFRAGSSGGWMGATDGLRE
jgi:hypothetical protein